ncbi:hypothetical protein VT569_07810 [Flavobacterium psychrophilum]|uniref:Acyltransferase n=2 Tax=Flavobacterium psychrophilum TaxID=96345 RepID=A0A7U2R8C1_FLAPS|nr:hypothetical protein [Flavobacterium psychrophilum]EKT3957060.1 hypothetical protein [Flavobacterium psychrophilum]EKT3965031.1 hypothetical protein [Flavobacterium psychrophilum]EKT4497816.1 hypothetical protein [Flavobacterium psychrophilum]EKT4500841.1 hypothetical protein [Flavobacterium psychrophilum]EKT4550906.1 hypothetical protein [Flavobacterium psychrophilum]
MHKNKYSIIWECMRFALAIGIILHYGDWFGFNTIVSKGNYFILAYLSVSVLANIYLITIDFKLENNSFSNT